MGVKRVKPVWRIVLLLLLLVSLGLILWLPWPWNLAVGALVGLKASAAIAIVKGISKLRRRP